MTEIRYGLLVKDIVILTSRQGADWWVPFRAHFEPIGRVISIKGTASPQGDHAWVRCGDPEDGSGSREDAESLRDNMIDNGVPRRAVVLRREPADLAATPRREA